MADKRIIVPEGVEREPDARTHHQVVLEVPVPGKPPIRFTLGIDTPDDVMLDGEAIFSIGGAAAHTAIAFLTKQKIVAGLDGEKLVPVSYRVGKQQVLRG